MFCDDEGNSFFTFESQRKKCWPVWNVDVAKADWVFDASEAHFLRFCIACCMNDFPKETAPGFIINDNFLYTAGTVFDDFKIGFQKPVCLYINYVYVKVIFQQQGLLTDKGAQLNIFFIGIPTRKNKDMGFCFNQRI